MWRLAIIMNDWREPTCHNDFSLTALLQLAGTELHQTSKEYRISGTVPSHWITQIGSAKVQLGFRGV